MGSAWVAARGTQPYATMDEQAPIQRLDAQAVFAHLGSRPGGLADDEARARLSEFGLNRLRSASRLWWLGGLIRQLFHFFTLLLLVAAVICVVADRLQPGQEMALLGWVLASVALLNALFSFLQAFRAERAMQALGRLLPMRVLVRRSDRAYEVPADELVPGDVIVLREGDRVPADARVLGSEGLSINNAPLTGESLPLLMTGEVVDSPLLGSRNVVFAGCCVVSGRGEAVVFATGQNTEVGRIASLSHETRRVVSPLQRETAHMVRVLTVIAVAMGVGFFIYGIVTGRPLWVSLVFMMGIIVANVPEGLLPTFTLSLAVASRRMARRQVLVKGLNAVEALGAVHVICTDKTGSLTQNRLVVSSVIPLGSTQRTEGTAGQAQIMQRALIASEIEVLTDGFGGDPLDVAIATCLSKDAPHIVNDLVARIQHSYSFDPIQRRSAGIAQQSDGLEFVVKGAWESLRPMIRSGCAGPGDADAKGLDAADAEVHRLSSTGRRVIAVAHRPLDRLPDEGEAQDHLETGLVLDGLIALQDPLREQVPDAVRCCHTAGVRVVMITGDHPDTAVAVAAQAGIMSTAGQRCVVSGDELSQMSDEALADDLSHGLNVFARTTPRQKLRIVKALQAMDKVVAVTGDGVNDAPALKAADVGIAMGVSGTDVARESAHVILLDDNFASIVAGVEEGRAIYSNIGKFTNYVLVSNGPEIIPYLLFILLPVPLALTVVQILAIDLCTDILPSIALGREPADPDSMTQPPRPKGASLLTPALLLHSYGFLGLIEAAYALTLFFVVLSLGGWTYGQALGENEALYRSATGITLATIMLMQIGNLFGRRSKRGLGLDRTLMRNGLLWLGVLIQIVLSWALLYVPQVSHILGTGPVPIGVYLLACLGAPILFCLDYLRKRMARRLDRCPALEPAAVRSGLAQKALAADPQPRQ